MKTLITLCTYNEVDNLRELIPELLSLVPAASKPTPGPWMRLEAGQRSLAPVLDFALEIE